MSDDSAPQIGQLFLGREWITAAQLDSALEYQQRYGGRLGAILVNLGALTERQVILALGEQLGTRTWWELEDPMVEPVALAPLREGFLASRDAVPLEVGPHHVLLAMNDPLDFATISAVERACGLRVEPLITPERELRRLKERLAAIEGGAGRLQIEGGDDLERLRELASEAPVIRLVGSVIARAVEAEASDIHFESARGTLRVRFRIDGVLHTVDHIPRELQPAVLTRLKLIAALDIAEQRLPQDGRIEVRVAGRDVDLRVSTVPTGFGESVVLRLLDKRDIRYELTHLGFSAGQLAALRGIIARPTGLFLVTGPTGSGKTTTLYSILSELNSEETKIMTVEDPVEYQLDGVNQVQVKSEIGYSFASALRSLLRQDPDVMLIGEIRDEETAAIAVQAALTGHRVFATLHTNDALGALPRLLDMGVHDYLLQSALAGVMAQRLVRRLCPHCRRRHPLAEAGSFAAELAAVAAAEGIAEPRWWEAEGCEQCHETGYRGRTTIAEIVPFDARLADGLATGLGGGGNLPTLTELGLPDLRRDGLLKVLRGETSLSEAARFI
ncbi:GspE/PulE family protein [Endothiovibrio diazotrophicus]